MSDQEEVMENSGLEGIEARHRREKKELQARIQALKKSIPKGDKKKNKESKVQIAILESELSAKHERELQEFHDTEQNSNTHDERKKDKNVTTHNGSIDDIPNKDKPPIERISKARKKREKKALKAKQQAEIASKAEADYVNTKRYEEEEKIKKILSDLSLKVKPMISDGNCLYYAVEDQLKSRINNHTSAQLRVLTSDYMLKHAEDFLPFLTKADTGDCYTKEEFEKYCQDIAETSAWGGQVELRALSHVLKTPIHVIQAHAPAVQIGDEYQEKPIVLTYHRHQFGLGEHYNSVTPHCDEEVPKS